MRKTSSCTGLEPLEPRLLLSAAVVDDAPSHRQAEFSGAQRKKAVTIAHAPLPKTTPLGAATFPLTASAAAALVAPTLRLSAADPTTIFLAGTPATGGTGTYTYRWHRGTTAGFTPASSTLLTGPDALTLIDGDTLTPGTPYYYVLEVNDGSTSAFSNQVIAGLLLPTRPLEIPHPNRPIVLGYMGSSTWALNAGSGQVPSIIDQSLRDAHPGVTFSTINGAVGGATTGSFLPGTSFHANVKNGMQAASGFKVLRLMLGSNDAAAGVPLMSWRSNIQAIINDALTWPVDRVVLEEIGIRTDGGNTTLELIRQYNAARPSLAGPKVLVGTAHTYVNQADHLHTLSGDRIHQTDEGQRNLAAHQAAELDTLFTPDTVAPAISTITATDLTPASATITWSTDEPATSRIEYGTTTDYGQSTPLHDTLKTDHTLTLSDLPAVTQIHYRIISTDAAGNVAVSANNTFTTPPGSGDPPLPGDANNDGKVDAFDLNILSAHWQTTTQAGIPAGDFNQDGLVDAFDLNILSAHWQSGVTP